MLFDFRLGQKNVTGSGFARQVMNMKVEERDSIVYKEIAQGNIPDLLRQPVYLTDSLQDADGKLHGVVLCVLPDFLTIGMNYDFCVFLCCRRRLKR